MVDIRHRADGRSRRADILAAAEREFGNLGWAGGRVERIAADARVNKQLLFHYFESKAGLFTAALESLLGRFEPQGPSGTPVEELRRVIRTVESAARTVPGILFQSPRHAGDDLPAAGSGALEMWRERQRARLASAVADGQRRGHFRDDLDPATVAGVGLAFALGCGALGEAVGAAAWMLDYCAWR